MAIPGLSPDEFAERQVFCSCETGKERMLGQFAIIENKMDRGRYAVICVDCGNRVADIGDEYERLATAARMRLNED